MNNQVTINKTEIYSLFYKMILDKINFRDTSALENKAEQLVALEKQYRQISVSEAKKELTVAIRFFDSKKDINWNAAESDIFNSLNWDDLKTGNISQMEEILNTLINLSSNSETLNWLNTLFLKHNYNSLFVATVLHTLSHMEYDDVLPIGPTIAMASLCHKDERVLGYAVKSFYNWNSKASLIYLRNNVPQVEWAKNEWNRTIKYIEKYGEDDGDANTND